LEKNRY